MRNSFIRTAIGSTILIPLALFTSCIDDNYDLSDIDTTTEVKVNDLTIPVNVKDLYLEKIVDLDDSDPEAILKIREINGEKYYFLTKGGDFNAEPTSIDKVEAPAPDHVNSTSIMINSSALQASRRKASAQYKEYTVTPYNTVFTYNVGQNGNPPVDDAIKYISEVGLSNEQPLIISMDFFSNAVLSSAEHVELYNLEIAVPDGLVATYGSIVSSGGKLTIPHLSSSNAHIDIDLIVKEIDFTSSALPDGIQVIDGKFDFSRKIGVNSGKFHVYPKASIGVAGLPDQIDFKTNYELSPFTVDFFSGIFNYDVDFDPISPLDLTDLPEFLSNSQTNLELIDPSLTLSLNNPIAKYGLGCEAGLTLTAIRPNAPAKAITLNSFSAPNNTENQFHILAPSQDVIKYLSIPAGVNEYFNSFPALTGLLAGQGLPAQINVDFKSAALAKPIVKGKAKRFPLGINIDQVNGKYEFTSPLALAKESKIIYSKTNKGWENENLDDLTINKMKVSAKISSTIPAGARLIIRPVGKDGLRIPITNEESSYAIIPAMASNQEVTLLIEGNIHDLNGLYIEAEISDFNGTPLTTNQTLKLSDLRITVSGNYTKEL